MALTFGFYNSKNGDRKYDATQMSTLFNGIIRDGVFANYPNTGNSLKTVPGTGMSVVVGPGRAWLDGTWTDNDGSITLPIDAAHVSLKRIDAVVLEINKSAASDNTVVPSVLSRANGIVIKKGTPASSPSRPTMVNANGIHQFALAYVTINAGVTSIDANKINDQVGTTIPFITGPLETISAESVINNWNAQWDAYLASLDIQFSAYRSYLDADWTLYKVNKNSDWDTYLDSLRPDIGVIVGEAVTNEYDDRIFTVHFYRRNTYQCDRTPTEIENAIASGKTIKAIYADQTVANYSPVPLTFQGATMEKHQVDPRQSPIYYKRYQFSRDISYAALGKYYIDALHVSYGWHPISSTVIEEDTAPSVENFTKELAGAYFVEFSINNGVSVCNRSFNEIATAYEAGFPIVAMYNNGSQSIMLPDFQCIYSDASHENLRTLTFVGNDYRSVHSGGPSDVTYKCSISNTNAVSIVSENYYRIETPDNYARRVFYIDGDNQTCNTSLYAIVSLLNYGTSIPGTFYCKLNGHTYSSSNFVIHTENNSTVDVTVTFIVAPDSAAEQFQIIKAVISADSVTVTSFSK